MEGLGTLYYIYIYICLYLYPYIPYLVLYQVDPQTQALARSTSQNWKAVHHQARSAKTLPSSHLSAPAPGPESCFLLRLGGSFGLLFLCVYYIVLHYNIYIFIYLLYYNLLYYVYVYSIIL